MGDEKKLGSANTAIVIKAVAKTAEFFEPFLSIYPQVCYVIKKGDFKERGCSRMDKLEKGAHTLPTLSISFIL